MLNILVNGSRTQRNQPQRGDLETQGAEKPLLGPKPAVEISYSQIYDYFRLSVNGQKRCIVQGLYRRITTQQMDNRIAVIE